MELTKRMVGWMDDWKRKTPSWLPRKKLLPLVGAIQHNHEQNGNQNNFQNIYTIWFLLCHIFGFLHHFLYGIFFLPFTIYFVKSFIYFFFSCFPFKSTFYYTLFYHSHFCTLQSHWQVGWLSIEKHSYRKFSILSFFSCLLLFFVNITRMEVEKNNIVQHSYYSQLSLARSPFI